MFNQLTTKAYIAATESFRRFKEDHKGVTAIEYGLIAVLIAAFIIIVFNKDGGFISALKAKFADLASGISGVEGFGSNSGAAPKP